MAWCCRSSVEEEIKDGGDEKEEQEQEEELEEEEDELGEYDDDMMTAFVPLMSAEADKTQHMRRTEGRRIIAEDPSWSLTIVPSLTDICIRHIADNFCC